MVDYGPRTKEGDRSLNLTADRPNENAFRALQCTSMGSISRKVFFFCHSVDRGDQSPPASSRFVVTAITSPFGSAVYHVKRFLRPKMIHKLYGARPRGSGNSVIVEPGFVLHRLEEDVKSSHLLVQKLCFLHGAAIRTIAAAQEMVSVLQVTKSKCARILRLKGLEPFEHFGGSMPRESYCWRGLQLLSATDSSLAQPRLRHSKVQERSRLSRKLGI